MASQSILEALDEALATGESVGNVISAFYGLAQSADGAERDAMLASLDQRVRSYPLDRIGKIALLAGAFVELGADASRFPLSVFDHLLLQLASIQGPDDGAELPEPYYQLERAAMAYLSRSAELRRALPQRSAILARLQRYDERYGFLGKMVQVLDDEPLLALHLPTKRGFRCTMRGIADNFQLHVLLLGALAAQGIDCQVPSIEALDAASDGTEPSDATVESSWQLANWFGLCADGTLGTSDQQSSWIWNEGVPADIASFDGIRVVLIGPSSYPRSWNAQRVFPNMIGGLGQLQALSAPDVENLTLAIRARVEARHAQG